MWGRFWSCIGYTVLLCGSSPRVWGRSSTGRPAREALRGSSPRVWGRSISQSPILILATGSSPRVWGRCMPAPGTSFPAAGSSPRVWGRCGGMISPKMESSGSSPRVWGRCKIAFPYAPDCTVHPHACGADNRGYRPRPPTHRFIPTRVGQMRCTALITRMDIGSSPRVWGRCRACRSME